ARGIVTTYLMTPEWQERFPHGLTRFGRADLLSWVQKHYAIKDNWPQDVVWPNLLEPAEELRLLRRAQPELRFKAETDPLGVNVLAHFCYPSGLQRRLAPRSTLWAVRACGPPAATSRRTSS